MTLTRRVMAEKRRYIYPLIAAVVLNAGLLIGVVAPLSKKVASGEQQAQEARTVLAVAKKDHAAARATVSGKDSADGELKKFYSSVLPPDSSAARRLTNTKVDEIARAAGVTRTGSTTKPSHDRDSELGKLTVTHSISGQYRDIRKFLYQLETIPDFLIVENVQLTQTTGNSGTLNVTVQVATYYRTGVNGN
jgi:Tfp pilus assembly protein PilO